jgi:P27 family predicted phage terminase small subunit
MGSRGPQPLPANVHRLRGNPSKLSAAELLDEFNPEVEIPTAPKWIWPEARKEWRRLGAELQRYGLVSKLDRAALVLYCQAWAKLVWAETMLSRAMATAEEKRLEAEAKGEVWKGGDGIMVPSPNGALVYSHHWVVQRRAAQEVHWYLQSFGLSPASRGRVKTSDNRQVPLFDQPGETAWNL